ncbi:MAG: hypothetical protein L6Q33_00930 [Bacteriovoracaceae bacterium]|jgi:tRNA threonylcarbamoyladenosine biosynthesis protein TsaB|nr:hypothetical protein [Bacteriovoracaceae bacterium]
MNLFIDTTSNLKIGILDKDCHWLHFENLDVKKPSEVIHKSIYDALQDKNLKISDIKKILTCAGPGSYTGMRLSEGIVQVLELNGAKACTFFHFEIPLLQGIQNYIWVATAFKGEYFIYHYDNGVVQKHLKLLNELPHFLLQFSQEKKYCLVDDPNLGAEFTPTSKLIVENPEKYLPVVLKREHREPAYYYRTVEEEFKIK